MSNFLISTGGSGGHVLPAIILYEHLEKKEKIIITTDKRGLKFIDKEKYDLEIIDTPKLENIYHLPINFFYIIILIIKSIFVLKNRKIKKIISIGGYMSLPLIIAARLTGLSIYLVEPNHVLGRANKFFLNFCKNIFCYSRSIKNFPKKFENKIIIISPLVKKEIYGLSCLNIKKNRFNLLIVGGSQGASFFDKNLKNIILKISRKNLIRITQQTNKLNVEKLKDFYSKNNIESKIFNFDKEFSKVIHQADLCITRAGASTLAELSVLNIPFIAVPLPSSKDNHQFENANFYKKNNCCWTLDQDDFEEKIESLLMSILNNKIEYFEKKENLKKLNFQNTCINVNQKLLKIINED
jgi:UDP-N-acetylglucosamine--N-acetylmuramyl-(pentapeptide) pyrophosphoryl-undecaprenol N-acetylglucosamine transferase